MSFDQASTYVKNGSAKTQYPGKEMSQEEGLRMYALFKCATVGTCADKGGDRPGMFSFEAKAKWDAWNALGNMSVEEAKAAYVQALTDYCPDWAKF
jgi:acyl-CoA-binding protein